MSSPIQLGAEELAEINDFLMKYPRELLRIPHVRMMVAEKRLNNLQPGEMRALADPSGAVIENAIEHNLGAMRANTRNDRPARLLTPLASIGLIRARLETMKVLTVGPRTELEIFTLFSLGFSPWNIRGLDMISYSDLVDLGDMHAMPYPDGAFDMVVLGWVLAYSEDNDKVAEEVLRVANEGAFIAVGCEYNPKRYEELRGRFERG